jgi:hypothetical protein
MKKKSIIALTILALVNVFAVTGCIADSFIVKTDNEVSSEIYEQNTESKAEKYYSADGTELNIDMSQYSEKAKLLTSDDIYLVSFDCGYISDSAFDRLIIENEEQLDCALENYGLSLPPEGLTEDELWYYNTSISEPFNEMLSEYPIDEYCYIIEYDEVNSDGYYFKAGALLVDTEVLRFVMTADSYTPDYENGEGYCDVMGGFCHMAAVPKATLMNEQYERWTYASSQNIE